MYAEPIAGEELAKLRRALGAAAGADPAGPPAITDDRVVLRYELVATTTMPRHGLPVLDLVWERFAQRFAVELEQATRARGTVVPEPIAPRPFDELHAELPEPCAALVLHLEGLSTPALLVVEPALMVHLLELVIGGPGEDPHGGIALLASRGFTSTERRICAHLTAGLSRALTEAWAGVAEVSAAFEHAVVDPRPARIFDHDEVVIDMPLVIDWEGVPGAVHMLMPFSAIRPFERELSRTVLAPGPAMEGSWRSDLLEHMRRVDVHVTAELGRTWITLDRLRRLAPGEILGLDTSPHGPLNVLIEGVRKMRGLPTQCGGNLAIMLSPEAAEAEPTDNTRGG